MRCAHWAPILLGEESLEPVFIQVLALRINLDPRHCVSARKLDICGDSYPACVSVKLGDQSKGHRGRTTASSYPVRIEVFSLVYAHRY